MSEYLFHIHRLFSVLTAYSGIPMPICLAMLEAQQLVVVSSSYSGTSTRHQFYLPLLLEKQQLLWKMSAMMSLLEDQ
jgi:hypothetical protein